MTCAPRLPRTFSASAAVVLAATWLAAATGSRSARAATEPRSNVASDPAAENEAGLHLDQSPAATPIEPAPSPSGDPVTPQRRALAIGASVFPGVVVHGLGNYVLGRPQTGTRLLALEGGGLGLILAGGVPIALTGAARDLVGPAAAVVTTGFGLFGISWMADVYSVAAPRGGFGKAPDRTARLEAALGYRYVFDPQFAYRHFALNEITLRSGLLRLSPSMWSSPDDANQRLQLEAAARLLGQTTTRAHRDGSYLDIAAALTDHAYPRDSFDSQTAEWRIEGRLDLVHVDPNLDGSFAEFGVGQAVRITNWEIDAASTQSETLLLARQAFGIYVGDPARAGGEWQIYYDHRHDGFAAGLLYAGLGSGVPGHLGLSAKHYFDGRWGLGGQVEIGSALVTGVSGLFRWSEP